MDRISTPVIVWWLAATLTAASPVPRLIGLDGTVCWLSADVGSVACNAAGPVEDCCCTPCEGAEDADDAVPTGAAATLCIACQCGISVIACPARLVPPEPEPSPSSDPPAVPASVAFEPTAPPPEVLPTFS